MSLRALRPFSTSVRALQRIPQVHPADVVAGKAAGPPTVRDTPEEVLVATVSDAPRELQSRQVRIFKPTKNTMQSAKGKTRVWRIDWDVLQGSGRWTNPLMGWQSSADYMQGTSLAFRTREDAVRFVSRLRGAGGRGREWEEEGGSRGSWEVEVGDGGSMADLLSC
jgi:NADH dehydrogenase (ubiquinone) Fe-S protein 4